MKRRSQLAYSLTEKPHPGFRSKPASKKGRVIGFLFGLPFFAVGLAFCWIGAINPILKVIESTTWPEVPCEITVSKVERHRSSDGTTYSIDIQFRYTYEGTEYEGGSYNFSSIRSSGQKSKRAVIRKYPVGSSQVCIVDPEDPTTAVLVRSIPGIVYFIIPFTSIFMCIGGLIMLGSIGLLPAKWNKKFSSRHKPVPVEDAGDGILEAKVGGLGKFFGAVAVATFWNGIVGVFLWQVVGSFQKGRPEWFLVVFLIPFVCIGVGMLIAVVYYFVALSNPRFTLSLSEKSPQLGDVIELRWRSSGSLRRLQHLRFTLEGEELATYRRGTDTRTDSCIFHRSILFETDTAQEHAAGNQTIMIPNDSMHSFDSSHNKIVWSIVVTGDIHRWPDVNERYPIIIRPVKINRA